MLPRLGKSSLGKSSSQGGCPAEGGAALPFASGCPGKGGLPSNFLERVGCLPEKGWDYGKTLSTKLAGRNLVLFGHGPN